ncbi:hypothetical protein Vadar_019965 [Vaccinium darrowii]|uniref:Uncharacterized protein n=1 Tax=Vaccinium darrowii TaxID=229202 RepID=A0ACB7X2A9_9ERIC|nr:hypothetical protein Vadar_019965 [Vaccinium darrowii]
MDSFYKAKEVRLFNHHLNKFLYAHEDEKSIILHPRVVSEQDRWSVEFGPAGNTIRLKSCHGTYLTASDVTLSCRSVKKVLQSKVVPQGRHLDSSVEWEPVAAQGNPKLVKLRTQGGNFLRANRGLVPWCDSVTHNVPRQEPTEDSVLWYVEWTDIHITDELHC